VTPGTAAPRLPDLLLLQPSADFYRAELATGDETLLVVEVSDTSLRYARDFKVPLYARHRAPEAWVADLRQEQLLVYA
jgi:Putative restriction endonuclease